MSRTLASFFLLAALGAAILAGRGLYQRVADPVLPGGAVGEMAREASSLAEVGGDEPVAQAEPGMTWQPIFGETAAPEPVVRTVTEAPPPSFDYALKGVIVSGDIRWAILTGAGQDHLVQEGDWIDQARIVAIRPGGIDIEIDGAPRSVAFSETAPVQVAEIDVSGEEDGDGAVTRDPGLRRLSDAEDVEKGRQIQEVIFQGMSKAELRDILKQAEKKRQQRGWVVVTPD